MSHSSNNSSRRCSTVTVNGRLSPLVALETVTTRKNRSIFTRIRRFKATPRHTEECKKRAEMERLSLSAIEEDAGQEAQQNRDKMKFIPEFMAIWLDKNGLGVDRKLSEEIDMKGTYSDEILSPLYHYMMLLGLNHTFTAKKWKTPMMAYNYTVLLLLICCTIRRITQIGGNRETAEDANFKGSFLDPTFVLTLCHAMLLFSGTSAAFLLLKLQKQRTKMYHILDQGLGNNRSKENDEHHFFMNRVMVVISFLFSLAMCAVQVLTKMKIINLPETPDLISNKFYFIFMEGYVIFLAQSSISMLAILFYQLCKILQISIVKLVEEMVPSEKEDCPLPEQSLQQIHDVQLHYQEIFTGKLLIESNFSFALFYTYGCCIPLTCLLGYITFRNRGADFMENMAVLLWIINTMATLALFSFPAFMIHEEGEKLLSASFKMYHETLCEERDLLILAQMNFLAFQMHSTKLSLSASHFFPMNRKILISGRVKVYEEINTEIYTFVSVSTTGDMSKPPEMCHGVNESSACGGIGSCLYCTSCSNINSWKSLLGAELLVDEKPLGCQSLRPGFYENVRLRFCVPRLSRFLETQGIEEEAIDHLLASTKHTSKGLRLNLFVTVYAFEEDVRPLLLSQRQMEEAIRSFRSLEPTDPLDASTHWSLPFNKLLHSQTRFIACHKLHATAFLRDSSPPSAA